MYGAYMRTRRSARSLLSGLLCVAVATMPAEHWLHPQSLCESTAIGKGTRVGAFSYVHAGATIGRDCDIGDSVLIENDVVLGDGVTVKNGVQLWDGLR